MKKQGLLIKIDTGLTPLVNDSKGSMLRIVKSQDGTEIASVQDHSGRSSVLVVANE